MEVVKMFEVMPTNGRASHYGKAVAVTLANGDILLRSYNTCVCRISADGTFLRLWDGYSITTMQHVNSFRAAHGLPPMVKKDWVALEVVA